MEQQNPWHRLFGLSWTDFFRGLPVVVETEKDLSIRKQLLDVVLIRKEPGVLNCRLPDGFENLAHYNLISFKSHQEKLSAWVLEELVGHYVNLRKQVSPKMDEEDLLPRDDFNLYAVCSRFPRNLADDNITVRLIQTGVYEVTALTRCIRVIVLSQLPQEEQNAMLHLFSANGELLAYGATHYRIRSSETSSLLRQLFQRYQEEVLNMPDKLEEFTRETIDWLLKKLPPEKRLEGLSTEKRLEGLSPEEMLAAMPPQMRERLAQLLKADTEQPKQE